MKTINLNEMKLFSGLHYSPWAEHEDTIEQVFQIRGIEYDTNKDCRILNVGQYLQAIASAYCQYFATQTGLKFEVDSVYHPAYYSASMTDQITLRVSDRDAFEKWIESEVEKYYDDVEDIEVTIELEHHVDILAEHMGIEGVDFEG